MSDFGNGENKAEFQGRENGIVILNIVVKPPLKKSH